MSNLLRNFNRRKTLENCTTKNLSQHDYPKKRVGLVGALCIGLVFMLFAGIYASDPAQMKAEDYPLGDIPLDNATFQKYYKNYPDKAKDAVPASYDARTDGIVSIAKNQGYCGSCWAFATVGAMESHIKKTYSTHPLYDLSEQQQVSCNTSMGGCNGGDSTAILFWESKGPNLETDYPYSSGGGSEPSCIPGYSELNYRVSNYYTTSGTENYKASLYDKGPSYWRFTVHSDFQTWWNTATSGSVYTNASYAYQGGHAVLLIGWDDAKGAFLCKNSWGATGGPNIDGTFWIAYSGHANDLGFGMCNFDVTCTGASGSISGRVTNASAVGIQNINVNVDNLSGAWITSVGTDASGNYTITGLPVGSVKVYFASAGMNYISEWYNDKSDFDTADTVAVTAGSITANINAQLAYLNIVFHGHDFNGNGSSDVAVFRPAIGKWYLKDIGTYTWGGAGDMPVNGDYDKDGKTDIAVFRPATGKWYVKYSGGGTATVTWGVYSDIPVPGDYDGDGKTDIAVCTYFLKWYVKYSGGGTATVTWGGGRDIPVPGDYGGDGKTDIAVFRPATGMWYVKYSGGGTATVTWGGSSDIPLVR